MSKVFTGAGKAFQEVQAVELDGESLREIVQRVKLQPHFLGEPLVVIADATDFPMIDHGGGTDLLALDAMGRTVVVCLHTGTIDAAGDGLGLAFAGHVATLPAEELGRIARAFVDRPANEPLRRAWSELGVEMSEETVELPSLLASVFGRDAEDYADGVNREQRILLAGEGFTTRFVSLVEWLDRCGVMISGLRYQKYLVGGQEIYFAEQVVPRLDPAVDAPPRDPGASGEAMEPWRVKGRSYHTERLTPALANRLDELLLATKKETFFISWNHKYSFWIRGERRNLRIRTYHRDRLEIGFYNISQEALHRHLLEHRIENIEPYLVGGYNDSPFVPFTAEMTFDERWKGLLHDWLAGAGEGESSAAGRGRQPHPPRNGEGEDDRPTRA